MKGKNEANREKSDKQKNSTSSLTENTENHSANTEANNEFDYPESSIENLEPGISEDARNWNSGSGVPKGDRNRITGRKTNKIDDLLEDEDDVL